MNKKIISLALAALALFASTSFASTTYKRAYRVYCPKATTVASTSSVTGPVLTPPQSSGVIEYVDAGFDSTSQPYSSDQVNFPISGKLDYGTISIYADSSATAPTTADFNNVVKTFNIEPSYSIMSTPTIDPDYNYDITCRGYESTSAQFTPNDTRIAYEVKVPAGATCSQNGGSNPYVECTM
jgi:hypothetical protein